MSDKKRISDGEAADIRGSMHITCGKKGGIGKSFVCRVFTEAVLYGLESGDVVAPESEDSLSVLDADPANHTLLRVRALGAKDSNIYTESSQLRVGNLDRVFLPNEDDPEEIRIIDMGSIGYMDIFEYMQETGVPDAWAADKKKFFFHTPLIGHERLQETLLSLAEVMDTFPSAEIFVWCNDYNIGSGSSDSMSVQQFLRHGLKKFAAMQANGKNPAKDLPPLHDVVGESRRKGFSSFPVEGDELLSIYYQAFVRSRNFNQYVVLANAETDGLRHISASVRDVLNKNETFTDFIDGPFERGARYRVAKFIYGSEEKKGVFFNIFKGLQAASGIDVKALYGE